MWVRWISIYPCRTSRKRRPKKIHLSVSLDLDTPNYKLVRTGQTWPVLFYYLIETHFLVQYLYGLIVYILLFYAIIRVIFPLKLLGGCVNPLLLKIKRNTTAHFLKSLFGIKQALIFQEFYFFVKVWKVFSILNDTELIVFSVCLFLCLLRWYGTSII